MKLLFLTIFSLLLIGAILTDDPKVLPWKNKWMMKTTSTLSMKNFEMNGKKEFTTEGAYYYDYTTKKHRFDRMNCAFDRFAGNVRYFDNSECRQYVTPDGAR